MSLCDVCARPAAGRVIELEAFRQAVRAGYNPFSMGLSGPALEQVATMAQMSGTDPYALWRTQLVERETTDWLVCDGCLPALRPFLEGSDTPARTPIGAPSSCAKCGGSNPASQWHCSHCGRIQWSLIVVSLAIGVGLTLWALNIASWWGRGIAGVVALLFLWIGVSSIREGIAARRYL